MTIRFNTPTPSSRDLLAPAGFSYCGTVALPEYVRVCCFALECIVTEQGRDNILRPLDCLKYRKGVYLIVEDEAAIYVGSSTKVTRNSTAGNRNWDLRSRVAQHFREKDSGGTLRENWYSRHRCRDYGQFVVAMRRCHLRVISFAEDANDQQVLRLEHLLIGLLGPRYCDVAE